MEIFYLRLGYKEVDKVTDRDVITEGTEKKKNKYCFLIRFISFFCLVLYK